MPVRRSVAALAAVVAMLLSAAPAHAAAGAPSDPSPYCRPVASAPYISYGPMLERVGYYKFGSTGAVSLNCNGPIYAGSITAIFHYQTNGVSGATAGPTVGCSSSCNTYAYYERQHLTCGGYYNYDDFTQITGWWQRSSSSSRTNISLESRHTIGSSHFPSVCR